MPTETFTYENLMGGGQKNAVQVPGTIAIGQSCARGTLLGLLTATGKWQLVDFQAIANYSDYGIAVEDLDTMAGEGLSTIFVEGEFNENGVTFGYSDTADDWRDTLKEHGIYLRASVNTSGY